VGAALCYVFVRGTSSGAWVGVVCVCVASGEGGSLAEWVKTAVAAVACAVITPLRTPAQPNYRQAFLPLPPPTSQQTPANTNTTPHLPAEVVEYAAGIGRDLMGEYVEHVSTGIDTFSIRQPLGVTAGICPFNFPGGRAARLILATEGAPWLAGRPPFPTAPRSGHTSLRPHNPPHVFLVSLCTFNKCLQP
jgi:hypothetical protein